MLKPDRWFVPVFLGIVIAAAAAAAACGTEPASPTARTAADSSAGDSIPHDSTPRDTVPHDTIPRDTIPRDTAPPGPVATSITVTPASQERAVGDSGVVTATVRDSTGREIWPAAIYWNFTDTSTTDTSGVLRIRAIRTSSVIFDAVRPGRARLIARFQDLADTGVVVVR